MIEKNALPEHALLQAYRRSGAYTDCYRTSIDKLVSQEEFVFAFYTTWLFKIERILLRYLAAKPSTDEDALRLARFKQDSFAAWSVEARSENQLLLCDFKGRTRSWLMTEQDDGKTHLYFGSGVVPAEKAATDEPAIGRGFSLLLGFHKLYSRALLSTARSRLARSK